MSVPTAPIFESPDVKNDKLSCFRCAFLLPPYAVNEELQQVAKDRKLDGY